MSASKLLLGWFTYAKEWQTERHLSNRFLRLSYRADPNRRSQFEPLISQTNGGKRMTRPIGSNSNYRSTSSVRDVLSPLPLRNRTEQWHNAPDCSTAFILLPFIPLTEARGGEEWPRKGAKGAKHWRRAGLKIPERDGVVLGQPQQLPHFRWLGVFPRCGGGFSTQPRSGFRPAISGAASLAGEFYLPPPGCAPPAAAWRGNTGTASTPLPRLES